MVDELSASTDAPMEGFFNGVNIVFATPASSATTPEVPTKATTLPTEPVPIDEGTHTRKVSEVIPVPVETPRLLLLSHPLSSPPVTPL